jgi:hypothetical protein
MEQVERNSERLIMPPDLLQHYINARKDTYASGKDPIMGLCIPGYKGYRYPEELPEDHPDQSFLYEDNYIDDKDRPGNFGGFETIKNVGKDKISTFYVYAGGLTEEGMKLQEQTEKGLKNAESVVYSRLIIFLDKNVKDVRFGNTVKFEFKDQMGKWIYNGKGEVNDYGWADDESVTLNGVEVHKLRGTGLSLIPGF